MIRNNRVHDNAASGIQINADPAMLWPELGTTGRRHHGRRGGREQLVWGNGRFGGAAINLASVRNSVFRNNLLYDNLAGGIAGWDDGNGDAWGTRNNTFIHNTIAFQSGEGRTATQPAERLDRQHGPQQHLGRRSAASRSALTLRASPA